MEFEATLLAQAAKPPAGDVRLAAFYLALADCLVDRRLRRLVERLFSERVEIDSALAANLLLRGLQKQLLRDPGGQYPEAFSDPNLWKEEIYRLLSDEERAIEYRRDILTQRIQSNIAERYKAFKIIIKLMEGRLGHMPSLLDAGCSHNHGLKKLALNLPFQPIIMASPIGIQQTTRQGAEYLLNSLLEQPIQISYGIGADIVPIDQEHDAEWIRACSFYPSEILDRSRLTEYDYLDNHEVSTVEFELADFTDGGIVNPEIDYTGAFNVIMVSTFFYQLSDRERQCAKQILRRYLSPGGIIIYQDFVELNLSNFDNNIGNNWSTLPFPYRTLVELYEEPGRIFEIMRWSDGRCRKLILGRDFYRLFSETFTKLKM